MSGRGSDRGRGRGGRGGSDGFRSNSGPPRGGGPGGGRGGAREQGGIYAAGQLAVVDNRLTDGSQEALLRSFKALTIRPSDLPLRPDFGTKGVAIKLRANFFPVRLAPKEPYYEYSVSITPAAGTAIQRIKKRIYQLAEKTPEWIKHGLTGVVAHDHSAKIIAAKQLPQPLVITVPYYDEDETGPQEDGKGKEYSLKIEYIQELETTSLYNHTTGNHLYREYDTAPIVSAINLILAAHPSRPVSGGVTVGRNRFFFSTAAPLQNLGGGLEAWKGFYSSVRPAHNQLMVNVNVCTTAFYKPVNLAQAVTEFRNASFGARPNAFVKGLRIRTTHLGYKKSVKALSSMNAKEYTFEIQEWGGTFSVESYFKRKYNITLRQPDLPLVDVGSGQKTNLLPMEVCEILPNQPYRGKLTDEHTASMILAAAKPPNVNAASIIGPGLTELGFRGTSQQLAAFGVSIGNDMTVVPGRILQAPGIKYGHGNPSVDERASWNLRSVKFAKGGRLTNWAVLVILDGNPRDEFSSPKDPELLEVIRGFASMCKASGMTVDAKDPAIVGVQLPPKIRTDPTRHAAIGVIREKLLTINPKPTVVMCFLSNGDKHVYSGIKYLCDVHLDLATVCVHSSKIRKERGQLQFFANVALKLNMKMGGINHVLDAASMAWLHQVPTMLIGIDVTHPGLGSVKGTPSIAATVASIDSMFAQFPASMEIQETKKEMVTDLKKMVEERLLLFRTKNNNKMPQRILVYRDGVSEGQFYTIVEEELPQIKAAFRKFDTPNGPYMPKLTIVICGKRHHTRFYPTEVKHADRDGNPRPGTVVDRGVTSIYNFDFFLQAHGGLQGTTRPTHYYVVHDEIGFKADELQGLTNTVSYMFARATKAVSLASPAYYADLACERGRCYLHKLLHGISSSAGSSTSGSEEQVMQEAIKMWRGGVTGKSLKDTMYYL